MKSNQAGRIVNEGMWIAVGQVLTLIGGFVLVRTQTVYMSPAEYGELALALTLASLVNQVFSGGLASGLLRFYSVAREKEDLSNYASTVVYLHTCATIIILSVSLLSVAMLVLFFDSNWAGLVAAAMGLSMVSGINSSLDSIQTAARHRMLVAIHMSSAAWLKILLVILFFNAFGVSAVVALCSYSGAVLIVMISQARFLFSSLEISQDKLSKAQRMIWNKKVLDYAWPFATFGVFTWIQQSSSRWALGQFSSVSDVGLFALVMQIGYAPVLALTGFATVLITPILFEMAGEAKQGDRIDDVKDFSNKLAFCGLLVTAFMVVFCALFHNGIFRLLVSEQYHGVSNFLPAVVAAGGIFAIGQIYANRILALWMSKVLIPTTIVSSLIGTIAAYVGAYYFSILGAVYAMLVYSTVYLAMLLVIVKNRGADAHIASL